jgi:hypothetical protein
MSFATVRDEHPDLPTAMERMANACCLSFTRNYCDEWLVREWRRQIEHAVQALGTGFAGLPEPIDFFYASNGVASFPEQADNAAELFERADQALYVAKGNGRNRTIVYPNTKVVHRSRAAAPDAARATSA